MTNELEMASARAASNAACLAVEREELLAELHGTRRRGDWATRFLVVALASSVLGFGLGMWFARWNVADRRARRMVEIRDDIEDTDRTRDACLRDAANVTATRTDCDARLASLAGGTTP